MDQRVSDTQPLGTEKVRLEGVTKSYASTQALAEVNLTIRSGEFITLLGPSGSGKTTLLNLIAGMTTPSSGRIWIDGKDATLLPANKRGLGMVFQNYALMPHMTVAENIAFPLRVRRCSEAEIRKRVAHVLDVVQLPHCAERKPTQLSGGQQQRIAIARCIVYNPAIVLMDEPLGALDKKLREEMQLEIKQLHKNLGITILYVTHDQEEALTMSDRIVLLNAGHIEQADAPADLYFHPRSLFAAKFLGDSNIIDAVVEEVAEKAVARTASGLVLKARNPLGARRGDKVKLMVRPQHVVLLGNGENTPDNSLSGTMVDSLILGGVAKGYVRLADGSTFVFQELTKAEQPLAEPGSTIRLGWSAGDTLALPG